VLKLVCDGRESANTAKYSTVSSETSLGRVPMKVDDYEIPDGLQYTKEHEWITIEGEKCRVGITDYAQKSLHEVVYVDLPQVGKQVKQSEVLGTVESVKAVSELYSPLSGEIAERNEKLVQSPELVNQEPYSAGWIVIVKPSQLEIDKKTLLTADAYATYLKELTKKK
jgi:glycine cleavage system H protein